MALVQPTSRVYHGSNPLGALYRGASKKWEPAPPFSPASLAGMMVWLDASQLGLADGAAVSPWPDLSGGGRDGAAVGAPAPVVRTNALNGKPVVRFKLNEGRFRWDNSGITLPWTVAYVGRMWSLVNTTGRVLTAQYPPSNTLIGYWNGWEDVFYAEGFTTPDAKVPCTTNWKLYSADGINGLVRCFSNGVNIGTTTTGGGFMNTLAISGYDPAATQETCDCEVAEVVAYNRRLSGAERQQIEAYLRTKWGL